jgi:hypothetical protein
MDIERWAKSAIDHYVSEDDRMTVSTEEDGELSLVDMIPSPQNNPRTN